MTNLTRARRAFATASLALAFTAAPIAFHALDGFKNNTASAREAESGGNHAGGKHGGGAGDDHPGAHNQNGKN